MSGTPDRTGLLLRAAEFLESPAGVAKRRRMEGEETRAAEAKSAQEAEEAAEIKEAADILARLPSIEEKSKKPEYIQSLVELQTSVLATEPLWDRSRTRNAEDLDLKTLVEFATVVYGKDFVDSISPGNPSKRAKLIRKFLQGNYSGDQCAGALRDTPFVAGKTPCWICGFMIVDSSSGAWRYECEHVFPIAQAVFFVDLFRGRGTSPSVKPSVLKLEYDHAHRLCNQVKGNAHFLNAVGSDIRTRKWGVDKGRIAAFLQNILDTGSYYNERDPSLRSVLRVGPIEPSTWIRARTDIIARRCEAILDATVRRCDPGLFVLASLAACRSLGGGRAKTRRHRRRTNRKSRRHLPK